MQLVRADLGRVDRDLEARRADVDGRRVRAGGLARRTARSSRARRSRASATSAERELDAQRAPQQHARLAGCRRSRRLSAGHEPLAVDVAEGDDRERDDDLDQHRAPERACPAARRSCRPRRSPARRPDRSSTGSAMLGEREKRPTTVASSGVRCSGASSAVAARSANTSTAIPPSHALIASTWRMFAGSSIATGYCTLVWPPSEGSSASAKSGTASAASLPWTSVARGWDGRGRSGARRRRLGRDDRRRLSPTGQRRSSGAGHRRGQARRLRARAAGGWPARRARRARRRRRCPRRGRSGCRGPRRTCPAARRPRTYAPSPTRPAGRPRRPPRAKPAIAANSRIALQPRGERAARRRARAASRRGRRSARRGRARSRAYWTRAGDGERGVRDRAGVAAGREQLVERLGRRAPSPTVKTKPLETAWPSADTTR